MGRLIVFEWKKIFRSRNTKAALGGCLLLLLAFTVMMVKGEMTYDENGRVQSGFRAIALEKAREDGIKGPLSEEKIEKEIDAYLKLYEEPKNLQANAETDGLKEEVYWGQVYPVLGHLHLAKSAFDYKGEKRSWRDAFTAVKEENAGYYPSYEEALEASLSQIYRGEELTEAEREFWRDTYAEVEKPFHYGYYGGWKSMLNISSWSLFIIFAVSVALAPMFAGEYQSGADAVMLASKFGKTKLVWAKTAAALLFTAAVFIFMTVFYGGIVFLCYGVEGAGLPIQMYNMGLPIGYDLNMAQAVFLMLGIGLLAALVMTGITLFASARMKSPSGVLVLSFVLLFLPKFVKTTAVYGFFNHLLALMPINALDLSFTNLMVYSFGDRVFGYPAVALVTYVVFAAVLLLSAGRGFRKHQIL